MPARECIIFIDKMQDDFICISETYLDSSVQSGDRDISINGYNLIHADHPSNNKRGGVCIYYRESLAVQLVKTNYT